jgi:LacI family transcriptional regulator
MAQHIRLRDVAERLGCSVAAVSKILNHSRTSAVVGEDLADRIRTAALELGYRVNYHAQVLNHGRSGTIGALHPPRPAHVFWAQILAGAHVGACQRQHRLLLLSDPADALEAWQQQRVDAVVIPWAFFADELDDLRQAQVPMIAIHGEQPVDLPGVCIDTRAAIEQAVARLAAADHRRLVWIHPVVDGERIDQTRFAHLQTACWQHDIGISQWPHIIDDHDNIDLRTDELARMLSTNWRNDPCDCLVCFNERMALAVYSLLADQNRRIGIDSSVLAFDDVIAPLFHPGLSTIATDLDQVGSTAVHRAIDLAASGNVPPVSAIPARLIQRASLRPEHGAA